MIVLFLLICFSYQLLELSGTLSGNTGKYFLVDKSECDSPSYKVSCGSGCIAYILSDEDLNKFILTPSTPPVDYLVKEDVEAYSMFPTSISTSGVYIEEEYFYVMIFNDEYKSTTYTLDSEDCMTVPVSSTRHAYAGGCVLFMLVCMCFAIGLGVIPLVIFCLILISVFISGMIAAHVCCSGPRRRCHRRRQQQQQQNNNNLNADQNVVVPVEMHTLNPIVNNNTTTTNHHLPPNQPMIFSDPIIQHQSQSEMENLKGI